VPLSKTISATDKTIAISIEGKFDYGICKKLLACIDASRKEVCYNINLSGVTHLDSSGLGTLLQFQERVSALEGRCIIINPSAIVLQSLQATFVGENFEIVCTR
jgi:anti-anti-sigma factor